MIRRRILNTMIALPLAALCTPFAMAAEFPTKPIRIVVPFSAGNSTDLAARIIARRLEERLKQPVIVENKPGAGGIIGLDFVAKAPPDGHTLVLSGPGLSTMKVLNKTLPFDPFKDLVPVSLAYNSVGAIAVPASLPANNLAEFVAYAKANPGKLNYGSLGRNTVMLGFEAMKAATGITLTEVPFAGGPAALQAMVRGDVHIVNSAAVQFVPFVETGKVRVLAVTTKQRLAMFPNAQTFVESGFPNLRFPTWGGFLAPAGTPADVVAKLSAEIAAIVAEPEAKKALFAAGQESAGSTPAEFKQTIEADEKLWTEVARRSNIQPE